MTAAPAPPISLADLATYRPAARVPAEFFAQYAEDDELADNVMFRAPAFRHHAADDETSADMIVAAARRLLDRHGDTYLDDVDVVLTHSQLPEVPVRGCVGEVAHRLGLAPRTVLDVHNGGCAAFVHLIEIAGALLRAGGGRKALIGLAQNSAGQIFTQEQVRVKAQAAIPGDGAAVATLTLGDSGNPVLGTESRSFGQFSADMTAVAQPERKYWEAGPGQIHVGFTEAKIAKVLARGNRMVPEVAAALADRIGVRPADLDVLVTNQPNRIFLRNWREALELPESRHPDTFDECGNLFAVGIPMTLDAAVDDGRVRPGDVVMMSAFAHAGDFAAAGAIRWSGRS
ncbi:3-oxoacyl-ACP synthase III family protein [Gordonia terrae]|uniref:3-oxoacyl-ACP synthase n=2 Tax=Gordonia terrae TaxID=2055 RepID=A0AAD0P0F2_9ACTN|nr:3-oxoacyl-[acyl-carrier-protein] synthase III C-terminal domain-containing protein [Gordonia terrae]VTR01496.1 3-oxoacyl-ACP synthase [Clostridioides difficile]ANY26033.1 3-oxoacyl-ACP synthase [Gordonia terrae]AWO86770.1 3-oxoacyl-ACP synthase [Gordonia terrae]VTS51971.1 3-oxoacyl-[acyl-carrier-protein] synthase 3 [Gordonia terrae]GAB45069.1 putative 3-oxoacyl-[acyl-carrier-protein] synthase [Gordonia terrae NBRC 100016]